MNNRERILAVLNYEKYDRLPVLHFGYWHETLEKWANEGHISMEQARGWWDGNAIDRQIGEKLGFDCPWSRMMGMATHLWPGFEGKVVEELPDGSQKVLNGDGVIVLVNPNATGIPAEVDHLLKGRKEWEEHYKHRFQFDPERVNSMLIEAGDKVLRFDQGGSEFLRTGERDYFFGLATGSLFGTIRNILGVVGSSYLYFEDEELFTEIIDTVGDLAFQCTRTALETGAKYDFAHFWEDICFKSGPLIIPSVFEEKVGPHYRRITELLSRHGVNLVSLDCDGKIDALIPTWFKNGVNIMFPMEVGTWDASIAPWREQYGRELRGVGGMNKCVFAHDYAAVDAEIERLKPLVDLGGYIPCPDHRIPPDAKWENVQYYCEKIHKIL